MAVLPIDTERIHLRVMRSTDAATLAAYRNTEETARFQDWPMPFSIDDAARMLNEQDHIDDVTLGRWVQVAIEIDTADGQQVVGDLAVGQPGGDHEAYLGYTIAPRFQGMGYASEAAAAMVDALFERSTVARIVVTMDPANHASMRVVEPLGFEFEGIARGAALVRGEWVDDLRFGLLRADRAAWLARSRARPAVVRLVEVEPADSRRWMSLETFRFQQRFVSPVTHSFADAAAPGADDHGGILAPWFRGIEADGEPVGFVMLAMPTSTNPHPHLWRLLIDRGHQRRGIGGTVVGQLIDRFRIEGHTTLSVSYVDAPGGPAPMYLQLGFVPTGEVEDDETIAALQL